MKRTNTLEPWQLEDAARLKALYQERATLSQAEFGARFGIGSQGMVWQYLNGRRPLNHRAAEAFATGLNIQITDFSPTLARQIVNASDRAGAVDGVHRQRWPFLSVDEEKLRRLSERQLGQIEAALLIAARHLGIDIAKSDEVAQ